MGYGWTDNWASSLTTGVTMPADIYTVDGLATDTGTGGPALKAAMNFPVSVHISGGDTYIVDTQGNRIQEIPGTTKSQWGISMTAGEESASGDQPSRPARLRLPASRCPFGDDDLSAGQPSSISRSVSFARQRHCQPQPDSLQRALGHVQP
jgi:hypothetical protein